MTETLDEQLDRLVLQNWGLVYQLHDRAEDVCKRLLDESLALLFQKELLGQNGLTKDQIVRSPRSWYLAVPYQKHQYLAYVQVAILTDGPRPAVRVYTAFKTGFGFSYKDVKQSVSADMRQRYGADYNELPNNTTTMEVKIVVEQGALGDLPSRIADEVERQLPVAVAIREYLAGRIASSSEK